MATHDPLEGLIEKGRTATQALGERARESARRLDAIEHMLASVRGDLQGALDEARTSIDGLQQRVQQTEVELLAQTKQVEAHVAEARKALAGGRERHAAAQASVDAAVARLRAVRDETLQAVRDEVRDAVDVMVAVTTKSDEALAQARDDVRVTMAHAAHVRTELARQREALEAARDAALAEYARFVAALHTHCARLVEEVGATRGQTTHALEGLMQAVDALAADADAKVERRFAVEVLGRIRDVSRDLTGAVGELRAIARDPRKLADERVFAVTRRLRDILHPLGDIEKAYVTAHKLTIA